MIITIDGPAGSGKSSVASILAQRLSLFHLDTGAMYRAVALDGLERGILADAAGLANRAREMRLAFDFRCEPARLIMDGRDVSEAIRTPAVTQVTYISADNPQVRSELVRQQQKIGTEAEREKGGLVTEGRDQGTVVFPEADFKFYLDAKPEERARRRIAQLAEKGVRVDGADLLRQIIQRDAQDQARPVGALKVPDNAIILDTTDLTLDQVVEKMYEMIKKRGN